MRTSFVVPIRRPLAAIQGMAAEPLEGCGGVEQEGDDQPVDLEVGRELGEMEVEGFSGRRGSDQPGIREVDFEKAGLNLPTSVMAHEFAPKGVCANAIVFGTFWTDGFRAGVPNDEAAEAAVRGKVLR